MNHDNKEEDNLDEQLIEEFDSQPMYPTVPVITKKISPVVATKVPPPTAAPLNKVVVSYPKQVPQSKSVSRSNSSQIPVSFESLRAKFDQKGPVYPNKQKSLENNINVPISPPPLPPRVVSSKKSNTIPIPFPVEDEIPPPLPPRPSNKLPPLPPRPSNKLPPRPVPPPITLFSNSPNTSIVEKQMIPSSKQGPQESKYKTILTMKKKNLSSGTKHVLNVEKTDQISLVTRQWKDVLILASFPIEFAWKYAIALYDAGWDETNAQNLSHEDLIHIGILDKNRRQSLLYTIQQLAEEYQSGSDVNPEVTKQWSDVLTHIGFSSSDVQDFSQKLSHAHWDETNAKNLTHEDLLKVGMMDKNKRQLLLNAIQKLAKEYEEGLTDETEQQKKSRYQAFLLWRNLFVKSNLHKQWGATITTRYAWLLANNDYDADTCEFIDENTLTNIGISNELHRDVILEIIERELAETELAPNTQGVLKPTITKEEIQAGEEARDALAKRLEEIEIFNERLAEILRGETEHQKEKKAEREANSVIRKAEREQRRIEREKLRLLRGKQ